MAIYGTYFCDECNVQFKGWRESDGPYPDCPQCGGGGGWAPQAPPVIGAKSKAVDAAYKMAEESFGLTDMNDNQRKGDIAAKGPSMIQNAEAEAITRQIIEAGGAGVSDADGERLKEFTQGFFGAGAAAPGAQQPNMIVPGAPGVLAQSPQQVAQQAIQLAPAGAAAARAEGFDPIGMLSQARGHGIGIEKLTVAARADSEGNIIDMKR